MPDTSDLSLYQTQFCPYCERVRRAAHRLGLQLELRDVNQNSAFRRELIAATGGQTVPCLRIAPDGRDGEWMHESAHIVAYLEERFAG